MRASSHYTRFSSRSNRSCGGVISKPTHKGKGVNAMPTQKTKHVSIVLAGSGEQIHEVEIPRGTTVRDLAQRLNLVGHLSKYGDTAPFGDNEELFARIEDGDKLVLSPSTPVAARRDA